MSNEIQQGLQDDLTTIEPDLMNMTRLFSLPDSVWDAPEYHFAAAIEGGQYVIRFYGKTQAAQGVTDIPSDADARIQALHRRRALRRLCRQTLYDLLRKETGIHPPWGSMTGIRPTHLMYEALNEGMSMADAQEHLVHQFDVAPEKAAGFGAIETDVRLSADGALVVMHDSTLNRTCLHADGTDRKSVV